MDFHSRTTEVNGALCRILGYTEEEMLGRSPLEFADEKNRKIFIAQMSTISITEHRAYEISLRREDGVNVPTCFSTSTLRDAAGNERGAFAFVADLSEQKAVDLQLRVTRDRLNHALEGSQEGLWDWHIQTGEVYFSPRMEHMLGYAPGEWESHVSSWERLVHPDDLPHVTQVLMDHLEGCLEYYVSEHRMRAKNRNWI